MISNNFHVQYHKIKLIPKKREINEKNFFSNDSGNLFENHILKRLFLQLKHLLQIIELVSV